MGFLKFFLHPLFIHLLGLHLVHPQTRGAISLRSSSRADFVVTITEEMRKPFVIADWNKLLDFISKSSTLCPKSVSLRGFRLEPCAGVIVSAAGRRSILVGGGGAPVSKNRQRRGVGANETGGLVVKSCIPMNPSLMSSS